MSTAPDMWCSRLRVLAPNGSCFSAPYRSMAQVAAHRSLSLLRPRPRQFTAPRNSRPSKLSGRPPRAAEARSARYFGLLPVHGPRVKGNYRRLLDALARGRFVPIGRGNNRRTLIYEDDVARASILAAGHPAAAGSIYNVTDGNTPPLADIILAMCTALGRRPPSWSLPLAPVRFGAPRVADSLARTAGRRLTIGAAVDKYVEDVAVDGRRIRETLGSILRSHSMRAGGWTVEALVRRRTDRHRVAADGRRRGSRQPGGATAGAPLGRASAGSSPYRTHGVPTPRTRPSAAVCRLP